MNVIVFFMIILTNKCSPNYDKIRKVGRLMEYERQEITYLLKMCGPSTIKKTQS